MSNHKKHRLKDLNWNAITEVFLIIVGAAMGAVLIAVIFSSCQKESSFTVPKQGTLVACDFGMSDEIAANGKRKSPRGPKPKPIDTTVVNPPPPVVNTNAVILLDFDGYSYPGGYWGAAMTLNHSGMSAADIQGIVDSIAHDYREFAVRVTTDEGVYNLANVYKRIRVVFTYDHDWYGGLAGGVAFTNSFTWGTGEPCFVFTRALGYYPKYVFEAGSHEAGHTFGLRHQCEYDAAGNKISEYKEGVIMGVGYYRPNVDWTIGLNSYGTIQDDRQMINTTLNQ